MIDVVAGDYYVTDLASTNGTYVDGEELTAGTPCKLALGAEVIFGACAKSGAQRASTRRGRGRTAFRRPNRLSEGASCAAGDAATHPRGAARAAHDAAACMRAACPAPGPAERPGWQREPLVSLSYAPHTARAGG